MDVVNIPSDIDELVLLISYDFDANCVDVNGNIDSLCVVERVTPVTGNFNVLSIELEPVG